MENRKKMMVYVAAGLLGTAVLTFLDQWTKYLAVAHLAGKEDIVWIPGVFQLQYLENRGAAFGILQNKLWAFAVLTVLYLIFAIWIFLKLPRQKHYLPLHIVAVVLTAGALGNFIDRIRLGYVVDFFYFSLIDFPIFNVADIYVVISFLVLVICIIFVYNEEDFAFLNKKKLES